MKLPKLYRPIKVKLWTLRNFGGNEQDVEVEVLVMRVLCPDGWKWQIRHIARLEAWGEWGAVQDQETLDAYGSECEIKYINPYF